MLVSSRSSNSLLLLSTSTIVLLAATWIDTAAGAELPTCGTPPSNTRGQCETCFMSSQCSGSSFCCPRMKKCVPTSSTGCAAPTARCSPRCSSSACNAGGCPDCHGCEGVGAGKTYGWLEWAQLDNSKSPGNYIKTCTEPGNGQPPSPPSPTPPGPAPTPTGGGGGGGGGGSVGVGGCTDEFPSGVQVTMNGKLATTCVALSESAWIWDAFNICSNYPGACDQSCGRCVPGGTGDGKVRAQCADQNEGLCAQSGWRIDPSKQDATCDCDVCELQECCVATTTTAAPAPPPVTIGEGETDAAALAVLAALRQQLAEADIWNTELENQLVVVETQLAAAQTCASVAGFERAKGRRAISNADASTAVLTASSVSASLPKPQGRSRRSADVVTLTNGAETVTITSTNPY